MMMAMWRGMRSGMICCLYPIVVSSANETDARILHELECYCDRKGGSNIVVEDISTVHIVRVVEEIIRVRLFIFSPRNNLTLEAVAIVDIEVVLPS